MKIRIGIFLVILHVVVLLATPLGIYLFLYLQSYSTYDALHRSYDKLKRDSYKKIFMNVVKNKRAIHKKNSWGETILHKAIYHPEAVEILLVHGADPDAPDSRSLETPLHKAADRGRCDSVLIMLKSGADIDLQSKKGWSTLHYTVDENDCLIKKLLAYSKDINQKDEDGDTALHLAARNASLSPLKLLLSAGADVNAKDDAGDTPLLEAIRAEGRRGEKSERHHWEQEEVIRVLLKHGADPNVGQGRSRAIKLASSLGQSRVVRMLLEAGSDPL